MLTSSRNDQCRGRLYRFGPFTLDGDRSIASVDGQTVALAPKVAETLAVLVEHHGKLVTKDELMLHLWPEGFVEESNLTQNIYMLRRVLAAHGLPRAIENVPRRGYRFTADVEVLDESPPQREPRIAVRGFIAAACMAALAAGLVFAFAPRSAAPPLSAESRRLYELGRYYWNLRTPAALERARYYFAAVVRRDPRSELGYAGLADTYTEMYDYVCDGNPCDGIVTAAQRYARRAVQVNPQSAQAHTSLAMTLRLFARDDAAADGEFRRAIALDPNYAPAHQWYGNALLARARLSEARKELEIAARLQPIAPSTYAWLARDAYYSHRYRDAAQNAREALAITSNRFESIVILGLALQQDHRYGEAIRTFEALRRMGVRCNDADGMIAGVYAAQGLRSRTLPMLAAQLHSCEPRTYVALEQATALIGLGDYSAALTWLKRVPLADGMQRVFLAMDPRLDPVRGDARFKAWTTVGR